MTSSSAVFDQDELLHLAIDATRRGDHGAALAFLKEGAQRFPDDARLAYMLGAEHAQIGLYERAEQEFERALDLAPELHTARFQLGLLRMTNGNVEGARTGWQPLEDMLPAGHALVLFKQGLEALSEERIDAARGLIESGLAANDFSAELNTDMENLLARINTSPVEEAQDSDSSHVWLSAYRNDGSH
jgi:Flp pilus assembly protein TadD